MFHVKRLDALAAEYALAPEAVDRLQALLSLLAADPHAPTAVREPEAAVDAHVADSLSALTLEPVRAATRIADLGSGAGFPGLVLAIARPEARVALVESAGRKAAFARAAAAELGLRGRLDRRRARGGLDRRDRGATTS